MGSKMTSSSSFGSAGRYSHDSSRFYGGRLYDGQRFEEPSEFIENMAPPEILNRIIQKSSADMGELPDHCVGLMVTSPPYNARKEYDEDLTLDEYRELIRAVMKETYRVLVTGGRACINLANLGRKPYLPLHAFIIQDMLEIGFFMRGEIIWNKSTSASGSTAWGTWLSATNPVLRDIHEYILVFSKGSFKRQENGRLSTIQRDDFLEWTKSVWTFPAVSARSVGHPAPFPIELPRRLIELYTYQHDLVMDPFCGSGTTCIAAMQSERSYVAYEIDAEYVALAENRIKAEIA
jgi:site-specific DNA-methyltransferase (adenine-specific)